MLLTFGFLKGKPPLSFNYMKKKTQRDKEMQRFKTNDIPQPSTIVLAELSLSKVQMGSEAAQLGQKGIIIFKIIKDNKM